MLFPILALPIILQTAKVNPQPHTVRLTLSHPLPDFAKKDSTGKRITLSQFLGRPVVLFTFCACEACRAVATQWAQVQRDDALEAKLNAGKVPISPPVTVIAFAGNRDDCERFLAQTRLDPTQTVLLPDPTLEIARLYRATDCPRVYVLDKRRMLRYANFDTPAQKGNAIPPETLTAHVLTTLTKLAETAPPALTLLPQLGLIKTNDSTGRLSIGEIDPFTTKKIERTFVLQNNTERPITIGDIRTSCGCETALLERDGTPKTSPTLKPGERITLRLGVNLNKTHGGEKTVSVWLSPPGSAVTLASLELKLSLRKTVEFSPSGIRFAGIPSGAEAVQSLSVTLDSRYVPNGKFPELHSSERMIVVEPQGDAQRLPYDKTANKTVKWKRDYRVRLLKDAPVGILDAALQFTPVPTPNAPAIIPFDFADYIPVTAEIIGSITALPRSVNFGTVNRGIETKRNILLFANKKETLEGLEISTEGDFTFTYAPPQDPAPGVTRAVATLTIHLSKNAPGGILRGNITIKTRGGETLKLGVLASIE